MTSEDRDRTFTQAAPLDLLFYPETGTPRTRCSTEKIELPEFATALCRAYESNAYAETRNGRDWASFQNDLPDSKEKGQIMPIFQLIRSAGIFDCQFNAHSPIDAKQNDIGRCATPHSPSFIIRHWQL
jgi:hypothetical protein